MCVQKHEQGLPNRCYLDGVKRTECSKKGIWAPGGWTCSWCAVVCSHREEPREGQELWNLAKAGSTAGWNDWINANRYYLNLLATTSLISCVEFEIFNLFVCMGARACACHGTCGIKGQTARGSQFLSFHCAGVAQTKVAGLGGKYLCQPWMQWWFESEWPPP